MSPSVSSMSTTHQFEPVIRTQGLTRHFTRLVGTTPRRFVRP